MWEFTKGDPHSQLLLCLGSHWYPHFIESYSVTDATRSPSIEIFSICLHYSTLPFFCSSVKLWGTQRAQRFKTPRWLQRILLRISKANALCILHLFMCYSGVFLTTELYFLQKELPLSNSICHSSWNFLYHLVTLEFAGDRPQNIWSNSESIHNTCIQESDIKSLHKNQNWKDPG